MDREESRATGESGHEAKDEERQGEAGAEARDTHVEVAVERQGDVTVTVERGEQTEEIRVGREGGVVISVNNESIQEGILGDEEAGDPGTGGRV